MPENYVITQTEKGNVCIAEDVISRMVSAAVAEVEGVAGLSSTLGSDLTDFLGLKSVPKGVKVTAQDGKTVIDVLLMVRYGDNVAEAGRKVQDAVGSAVEAMTGMNAEVNVHVTGISFEKAEIK